MSTPRKTIIHIKCVFVYNNMFTKIKVLLNADPGFLEYYIINGYGTLTTPDGEKKACEGDVIK